MDKAEYLKIEMFMRSCMHDSAHDEKHVYRVLYAVVDLAENVIVDRDVLIAAALLHDIGRDSQYRDKACDHAAVGARMAFDFLLGIGWDNGKASHVSACIETHRYRSSNPPVSMEAKIIFDADKLDATGAMGIARTIMHNGIESQPLYHVDDEGRISTGDIDHKASFFREYNWKLKNVYDKFYTKKAAEIAARRREASIRFYESLFSEVNIIHDKGIALLKSSMT
jgi:uncharacterized protein